MMLYCLTYPREGRERRILFWADDLIAAEQFRALWSRLVGSDCASMPAGRSRFEDRGGRTQLRRPIA